MSQPFDRTIINPRDFPRSGDVNELQAQMDFATRYAAWQIFNRRAVAQGATFESTQQDLLSVYEAAFIGNGFRVNATAPASMNVVLEPGLGWFNTNVVENGLIGIAGLDDPSPLKPLWNPTQLSIPVPAPAVNPRIDIVEVRVNRTFGDLSTVDIMNPTTFLFAPTAGQYKTLSYAVTGVSVNGVSAVNLKTGVPNAVPVAPTVDAGYFKIAEVYVDAAPSTSISNLRVADLRPLLLVGSAGKITLKMLCNATPGTLQVIDGPPGLNVTALWDSGTPTVFNWIITGGAVERLYFVPHHAQNVPAAMTWMTAPGSIATLTPASIPNFQPPFFAPAVAMGPGQKIWFQQTGSTVSMAGQTVYVTFDVNRIW